MPPRFCSSCSLCWPSCPSSAECCEHRLHDGSGTIPERPSTIGSASDAGPPSSLALLFFYNQAWNSAVSAPLCLLRTPPVASTSTTKPRDAFLILGGLVLVTACLYWARQVLIPVALAVLLTFILTPAVSALQRRGLGRVFSVMIV